MSKEDLAESPIRFLLKQNQIWIEIGYDLESDIFLLTYLGISLRDMRELEVSDEIFKHKVVDTSTRNLMRLSYLTIYHEKLYATTVSLQHKTKRLELSNDKAKTVQKGHKINNPACYPVALQCEGEIDWKVSL